MDRGGARAEAAGSAHPPSGKGSTSSRDVGLVAGMARADPSAMAAFYDAYAPEVFALIRGMVGDETAAQDILQETMWQAWRLASRYDPARASVRTWLHLLMRSRVLDWRRRERRGPVAEGADQARELADPQALSEAGRAADRQDLLRAQSSLSEAEREVIRLTYYHGLTQAEAAQALGLPLGTVKSRVRSALMHLQRSLAPERSDRGGPP